MDRPTGGQTGGRTASRADGRTGRTDGRDGRADRRANRTDGTDERTNSRTDGRADGRTTGYFSKFSQITPFPTLPRKKPALLRGRRLHNGLRDVRMARPSSSHRQPPPAGSLPCFYDSREKFVHFGSAQPGRARLVRARACRGQNSDFEKILCQNVRHNLEAFRRFFASETPIFKETVGTF